METQLREDIFLPETLSLEREKKSEESLKTCFSSSSAISFLLTFEDNDSLPPKSHHHIMHSSPTYLVGAFNDRATANRWLYIARAKGIPIGERNGILSFSPRFFSPVRILRRDSRPLSTETRNPYSFRERIEKEGPLRLKCLAGLLS